MWRHSEVPSFISDISANRIGLSGKSPEAACQCKGPTRHDHRTSILFENDLELAEAINCLVARGVMLMDYEHSWPPAAVADSLREKGYSIRDFRRVSFDGTWFKARD
jgi:hypothetical protein